MPPLPSDAAAFPGETVVAAKAVVNFDIATAGLGGSEGAAATDQTERTVGDGGGNVTPTAVTDLCRDNGPCVYLEEATQERDLSAPSELEKRRVLRQL